MAQLVVPIDAQRRTANTAPRHIHGTGPGVWQSSVVQEAWPGLSIVTHNWPTLHTPAWPAIGGTLKAMRYDQIDPSSPSGLMQDLGCRLTWGSGFNDILNAWVEWCRGWLPGSDELAIELARPLVDGALLVETIGYVKQMGSFAYFQEAQVLGDYVP
jgi:hypothetical protein